MKVLVIGGAGYIGSTVSQRLHEQGHDVTVLDLLLFGGESLLHLIGKPRFKLIPGDLRNEETLDNIMQDQDAVILLAAIVGEPACNRDPDVAVETNLKGGLKVLAAAKKAGVAQFIFSSTCSNYGVSDTTGLVNETAPLQPISTYSETKVAAETAILAAADENFCSTVLRFSTAFGVSTRMRFDLMVSDFTKAAVEEGKVVIFGEQFWRPFVHIQDISLAIEKVLEAERSLVCGEVFNVGANAANIQKVGLANSIAKQVAGSEIEFVKRDQDPRSYRVDFTKITERLGYQAQWTIDDGIEEVHDHLKAGVWADTDNKRYYN